MAVDERPFGWHNIVVSQARNYVRQKTTGWDAIWHAVQRSFSVNALEGSGPFHGRILSKVGYNPKTDLMLDTPQGEISGEGNSRYRCKVAFEDSLHSCLPFPHTLSAEDGQHHAVIDLYPWAIPEHAGTGNPQLNDYVLCDINNAQTLSDISFRTTGAPGNSRSDTGSDDRRRSTLSTPTPFGNTIGGQNPYFPQNADTGMPCIPTTDQTKLVGSSATTALVSGPTTPSPQANSLIKALNKAGKPGRVWSGGVDGIDSVIYTSDFSDLSSAYDIVYVFTSKTPDQTIIETEIIPSVTGLVDAMRNFVLVVPTGNISGGGMPNYVAALGKQLEQSYGVELDNNTPGGTIVAIGGRGMTQIKNLIDPKKQTQSLGGIHSDAFTGAGTPLSISRVVVSPDTHAQAEAMVSSFHKWSDPAPTTGVSPTIDEFTENVVIAQQNPGNGKTKIKSLDRVTVHYRPGGYSEMKNTALSNASSTFGKPLHTAACQGSPGAATPWGSMPTSGNTWESLKPFLDTYIPGTRFKWGVFVKKLGSVKYPPGHPKAWAMQPAQTPAAGSPAGSPAPAPQDPQPVPVNTEKIWQNISHLAKGLDNFWLKYYPDAEAIFVSPIGGFRDIAVTEAKSQSRVGMHGIGCAADIYVCKKLKTGTGTPGQGYATHGTHKAECAKKYRAGSNQAPGVYDSSGVAGTVIKAMKAGVFGRRGGVGFYGPGSFVHVDIGPRTYKDANSFLGVFPTHNPVTGKPWENSELRSLARRPMTWVNDKSNQDAADVAWLAATKAYRKGKDSSQGDESAHSPKNTPGTGLPESEDTGTLTVGDAVNTEDSQELIAEIQELFDSPQELESLGLGAAGMQVLGIDPYAHQRAIIQASALQKISNISDHIPVMSPLPASEKVFTMATVNITRKSGTDKQRINIGMVDAVTGVAKTGSSNAVKINIDMRYPEIVSS